MSFYLLRFFLSSLTVIAPSNLLSAQRTGRVDVAHSCETYQNIFTHAHRHVCTPIHRRWLRRDRSQYSSPMSSGKRSHKHVSKDDGSEGAGGPENTPRAEGNAGSILAPCLNCSKPHIYARDRKACDSRYALSAVCTFYDTARKGHNFVVTRPSFTDPFVCPNTKCKVTGQARKSSASNFILHSHECTIESPSDIGISGADSMSQSTGSASAGNLEGSVSAASTLFKRQVRPREEEAGEEAERG